MWVLLLFHTTQFMAPQQTMSYFRNVDGMKIMKDGLCLIVAQHVNYLASG